MIRAIMFHLGATKEPPPLPDPNEMSDQGIEFIDQCLSLDPEARPVASELLQDEWLVPMLEQMVSCLSCMCKKWSETYLLCKTGRAGARIPRYIGDGPK